MKNPRQPEKRGNADGSKKVWEHRQSTGSGKPRQYPMFPTPSGMGNLIGQVCRSNLPDLWIPVTTRLPIEIVCFSTKSDVSVLSFFIVAVRDSELSL